MEWAIVVEKLVNDYGLIGILLIAAGVAIWHKDREAKAAGNAHVETLKSVIPLTQTVKGTLDDLNAMLKERHRVFEEQTRAVQEGVREVRAAQVSNMGRAENIVAELRRDNERISDQLGSIVRTIDRIDIRGGS